jgi:hypothetical protein
MVIGPDKVDLGVLILGYIVMAVFTPAAVLVSGLYVQAAYDERVRRRESRQENMKQNG